MAAGIGVGATVMVGLAVALLVVHRRKSQAASDGAPGWGGAALATRSPLYMGDIGDDLGVDHRAPAQFAANHHGDSPVSPGMGGARANQPIAPYAARARRA